MRVAQINATCGSGSTGKISVSISKLLTENGIENIILYSQGESEHPYGIKITNEVYKKFQALKSRIMGNWGFNSKAATETLIKKLTDFSPDLVHIHNIHAHDCDIEMLFDFLKEKSIPVLWTFHDCWALTGYCVHFTAAGCSKWKDGCKNCTQKRKYTWLFDRSEQVQRRKIDSFAGCDLSVAAPSRWMADIVRESKLKEVPTYVVPNGIDTDVFCRRNSAVRERYSIAPDAKIILGVSSQWSYEKGLDTFLELADVVDSSYKIILVGTDAGVDKHLPDNVISIHRTTDQNELSEIYSAADVFFNPTREDTFPTVNMEALACGTPVLTFDACGSPEEINDSNGLVLHDRNIETLINGIDYLCSAKMDREKIAFVSRKFDYRRRLNSYLTLYNSISKV